MARRTQLKKLPRKRYKTDRALTPIAPNVALSGVTAGTPTTRVNIAFAGPVLYNGDTPPQSWRFKNQVPLTYFSRTSNSCVITVTAAVVATDAYVIAANDPAIRTQAGGYIAATAGLVS